MSDDAALLKGLKVIDAASFIAAPVAATVMADFGADVIKVEAPGGDGFRDIYALPGMPIDTRNYAWEVDNRSKRGICIDLRSDAGRTVLDRLLDDADVLITNFVPRVRQKLGLRYQDLKARYPRLIYASMSAYGEAGPEAEKTGFDSTALWARSGLMDLVRPDPDTAPARSLPGMGDHPSGMSLLAGIMMALWQRERTGQGSQVSTSLVANGIWMNAFYGQAALNRAEIPVRPPRDETPNALSALYRCSDDRWFLLAIVNYEDRAAPGFFKAIGREDLLQDPRFATSTARRQNAAELMAILDQTFASADWPTWQARLTEHGVTFGTVARNADMPEDKQLRHAGAVVDDHLGRPMIGSPVFVGGAAKRPPAPAPGLGEHTREILAQHGYGPEDIDRMLSEGVVAENVLAEDTAAEG
ncbi:MAG: CoA transferase [Pseudomonadota bacterium]